MMSRNSLCESVLVVLLILVGTSSVGATWSIVAVDRASGQVGIAGASCTFNVQGIGEVIPGVGAVVVQAMSNDDARSFGVEQLRNGSSAREVLQGMRDPKFDPENQQYAVLTLNAGESPVAYSGRQISSWHGAVTGDGFAIQGNILVGAEVLMSAVAVFQSNPQKRLAQRLVDALLAGAEQGGDKRCGEQAATSAFVTVYNSDDDPRTPYFHLVVYGIQKGAEPAVSRLAKEFQSLWTAGADSKSTRLYVVP